LRIVAQIARVAHVDAEPLAAFDGRGHGLAAQRRTDHILNVLHHDAVTRQRRTVRRHIEIISAKASFGISR
jgi:hypothetical protein